MTEKQLWLKIQRLTNKIPTIYYQEMVRSFRRELVNINKLASSKKVKMNKTLKRQKQFIYKLTDDMMIEIKAQYGFMIKDLYKEIVTAIDEFLGQEKRQLATAINKEVLKILKTQGFMYLDKYKGDIRKKMEMALMDSILSGESYFFAVEKMKAIIDKPFKGNLHRLIQAETARVMQEATWNGLKENQKAIQKLEWHGILDDKTTDWCKNRMALNPWYFEVVEQKPETFSEAKRLLEQYEADNGLPINERIKPDTETDRLFDPKYGTFMHPHINCRKNWVGYPEFNYEAEVKKAKSRKKSA